MFFLKRGMNLLVRRALTGFSAGAMMAASIWRLLVPAMEQAEDMGKWAFRKCRRNDFSGLKADGQLCFGVRRWFLPEQCRFCFLGRSIGGSAASARITSYAASLFSSAFRPGKAGFIHKYSKTVEKSIAPSRISGSDHLIGRAPTLCRQHMLCISEKYGIIFFEMQPSRTAKASPSTPLPEAFRRSTQRSASCRSGRRNKQAGPGARPLITLQEEHTMYNAVKTLRRELLNEAARRRGR